MTAAAAPGEFDEFDDHIDQVVECTENLVTLAGQAKTTEELGLILQGVAQGLLGLTKLVMSGRPTTTAILQICHQLSEQQLVMQRALQKLQGVGGDDDEEFEFFNRN